MASESVLQAERAQLTGPVRELEEKGAGIRQEGDRKVEIVLCECDGL